MELLPDQVDFDYGKGKGGGGRKVRWTKIKRLWRNTKKRKGGGPAFTRGEKKKGKKKRETWGKVVL